MPIDFHSENNRFTYAKRDAHSSWIDLIQSIVDVKGKQVVDIGCGGGIYAKVFADLGASSVTGVDFSEEMLKGARVNCSDYSQISFMIGDALNTGLPESSTDIILEKALIHHLRDLNGCFSEAFRILKSNGKLIVQDRTPEDCLLPGSNTHIRGYFFSRYPKLIDKEVNRRHEGNVVKSVLSEIGFSNIQEISLWETRKTYSTTDELSEDLLSRTGRSILYELTDEELSDLVSHIEKQLKGLDGQTIVEQDRWTIWVAEKSSSSQE